MLVVHGPEKALRAPLARLDKVGHVNAYIVSYKKGGGERGYFTVSPIPSNRSVGHQTQGQHHILHGVEVFAAVQPNCTNDSF